MATSNIDTSREPDLEGGKQVPMIQKQADGKSVVDQAMDGDRGSKTSSEPGPRAIAHATPTTSLQKVPSSSNASVSSSPTQPPGVFRVLRVTDLEPQPKPMLKLGKADVLKRAEEKREELRAKFEQVKLKLWETTIEHGALVHLMRLCTDPDQAEPASPNSRTV
jgi:hypothetical protein